MVLGSRVRLVWDRKILVLWVMCGCFFGYLAGWVFGMWSSGALLHALLGFPLGLASGECVSISVCMAAR